MPLLTTTLLTMSVLAPVCPRVFDGDDEATVTMNCEATPREPVSAPPRDLKDDPSGNQDLPASQPEHHDIGRTRLLLGPTARGLRRGEFYVDFGSGVGGPFVQLGLSDRVSMGAGTPLIVPGLKVGSYWTLAPKVQLLRRGRTAAAVGTIHMVGPSAGSVGFGYGAVTHGSTDAAVTAGVGFGYTSYRRSHQVVGTAVILGGEKRVGRRVSVMAENYIVRGGGLLGGGIRVRRRHATYDLGVMALIDGKAAFAFPVFRLAWNR